MAVNAELKYPLPKPQRSAVFADVAMLTGSAPAAVVVVLLVGAWEFQHKIWARIHPGKVVDQIKEMERLPVIFNSREKAFGALYYIRLELILGRTMSLTLLNMKHLE